MGDQAWRSIESLPADLGFFIAAWRCAGSETGYDVGEVVRETGNLFFNLTGRLNEPPTHWMPLPDPPLVGGQT